MKKNNLDILSIAIAAIPALILCCSCSEKAQKATEVIITYPVDILSSRSIS